MSYTKATIRAAEWRIGVQNGDSDSVPCSPSFWVLNPRYNHSFRLVAAYQLWNLPPTTKLTCRIPHVRPYLQMQSSLNALEVRPLRIRCQILNVKLPSPCFLFLNSQYPASCHVLKSSCEQELATFIDVKPRRWLWKCNVDRLGVQQVGAHFRNDPCSFDAQQYHDIYSLLQSLFGVDFADGGFTDFSWYSNVLVVKNLSLTGAIDMVEDHPGLD
jgi:hypothetical protein